MEPGTSNGHKFPRWVPKSPQEHNIKYQRFRERNEDLLNRIFSASFDALGGPFKGYLLLEKGVLSVKEFVVVMQAAADLFMTEPTLLEIDAPVTICGDIHGQFHDLLRIFLTSPKPPVTRYLFLGDYVDRGAQSLECVLLLFTLKLLYPNDIFLLRGNHETSGMNCDHGLYKECDKRLEEDSHEIFGIMNTTFNCMPVAANVGKSIFCAHGGISPFLHSMDQIRNIKRPCDGPDVGLMADIMWSDPAKDETVMYWGQNSRGCSFEYGPEAVKKFLEKFDLDFICRAHECFVNGYRFSFNRTVLTVFSAPIYADITSRGAFLKVSEDLECTIKTIALVNEYAEELQELMEKYDKEPNSKILGLVVDKAEDMWDDQIQQALMWTYTYVECMQE